MLFGIKLVFSGFLRLVIEFKKQQSKKVWVFLKKKEFAYQSISNNQNQECLIRFENEK